MKPSAPLALVALVPLLAACETTSSGAPTATALPPQPGFQTATPAPFGPTPDARRPGFAEPAPAPTPIQRTTVTERTSISPDGSTVRTERTTTSVGFDPARAAAALGAIPVAAPAGARPLGVAGSWKSQSAATRVTCDVALYGGPQDVSGRASSNCAWGSTLHGVTDWSYDGRRLTFTKGSTVAAVFDQLGPDRFDARVGSGLLSTTLALYR